MSNFFKKALPYAAGALTSGVMSQFAPTKNFSALGGAAAGALTNKKNRLAGALQGGIGGAAGQALAGGAKNVFGQTGNSFTSGMKSGFNDYIGQLPGFKGFGTSAPTGAFAQFLSPKAQQGGQSVLDNGNAQFTPIKNAQGVITGYNPTGVQASTPTGVQAPTPASSIVNNGIQKKSLLQSFMPKDMNMGQFLGGAGVTMLGGMLAPDVEAPDFSGILNPLRDQINTVGPNSQAAIDAYMQQVSPQSLDVEPALANIQLRNERAKADAIRALDQQFQANMGGAGNYMDSSAYQDARSKLEAEFMQNYNAQVAQSQLQYDMAQRQNQMAAANALANLDQAQIQSLANLANYDIYSIMQQTGYDYAKAQALQSLAQDAGGYMMKKAVGAYDVPQKEVA